MIHDVFLDDKIINWIVYTFAYNRSLHYAMLKQDYINVIKDDHEYLVGDLHNIKKYENRRLLIYRAYGVEGDYQIYGDNFNLFLPKEIFDYYEDAIKQKIIKQVFESNRSEIACYKNNKNKKNGEKSKLKRFVKNIQTNSMQEATNELS